MQQVLVIHGGDAFETREGYIESLKERELSLARMKQKDWKRNLQDDLGSAYDVYTPRFPNAQNARYEEWKIIFDKMLPLMNDNVILIGHSLGGLFLVKYLSENIVDKKIKSTLLVAAPYNTKDRHPLVDFTINEDFTHLAEQGGRVVFYHSEDDKIVNYKNAELYKDAIPTAIVKEFTNRGHFNLESFPEIIEDIQSL